MPQKTKWPIIHDKCPKCGSKETHTSLVLGQLIKERKLAEGSEPQYRRSVTLLMGIAETQLIMPARPLIPALVEHLASCAICGCEYCIKADFKWFPVDDKGQLMIDAR
jgi:hypothetical protein